VIKYTGPFLTPPRVVSYPKAYTGTAESERNVSAIPVAALPELLYSSVL